MPRAWRYGLLLLSCCMSGAAAEPEWYSVVADWVRGQGGAVSDSIVLREGQFAVKDGAAVNAGDVLLHLPYSAIMGAEQVDPKAVPKKQTMPECIAAVARAMEERASHFAPYLASFPNAESVFGIDQFSDPQMACLRAFTAQYYPDAVVRIDELLDAARVAVENGLNATHAVRVRNLITTHGVRGWLAPLLNYFPVAGAAPVAATKKTKDGIQVLATAPIEAGEAIVISSGVVRPGPRFAETGVPEASHGAKFPIDIAYHSRNITFTEIDRYRCDEKHAGLHVNGTACNTTFACLHGKSLDDNLENTMRAKRDFSSFARKRAVKREEIARRHRSLHLEELRGYYLSSAAAASEAFAAACPAELLGTNAAGRALTRLGEWFPALYARAAGRIDEEKAACVAEDKAMRQSWPDTAMNQKHASLVDWIVENGGRLNPKLSVRKPGDDWPRHALLTVLPGVELLDMEEIMFIPHGLNITYESLYEMPRSPKRLDKIKGAAVSLARALDGQADGASFWKPYVDTMPIETFSVTHLGKDGKQCLRQFGGSARKRLLEREHLQEEEAPRWAVEYKLPMKTMQRAVQLLLTQGVRVLGDQEKEMGFYEFVPGLDLLAPYSDAAVPCYEQETPEGVVVRLDGHIGANDTQRMVSRRWEHSTHMTPDWYFVDYGVVNKTMGKGGVQLNLDWVGLVNATLGCEAMYLKPQGGGVMNGNPRKHELCLMAHMYWQDGDEETAQRIMQKKVDDDEAREYKGYQIRMRRELVALLKHQMSLLKKHCPDDLAESKKKKPKKADKRAARYGAELVTLRDYYIDKYEAIIEEALAEMKAIAEEEDLGEL
eukprot:TRINITY_DN30309_c0_g1_i1.p1 TRINITY_DN30309_c0_g1~~TRINITY_DN30309_c0_g1_i1.p1  ORF type:complete len:831 (+),score=280.53 TRINITY_DN30309_c0_g1_i1:45-2537(+)